MIYKGKTVNSWIEEMPIKDLAAGLTEDLVLDHSPMKTQKTSGIMQERKNTSTVSLENKLIL